MSGYFAGVLFHMFLQWRYVRGISRGVVWKLTLLRCVSFSCGDVRRVS